MPGSGKRVLVFDPRTGTQTRLGPDLNEEKRSLGLTDAGLEEKYTGGVLANNGCIYAIPRQANRVLKIDPSIQKVTCIGDSFFHEEEEAEADKGGVHVPSSGPRLWLDGALGGDGCIYCCPHDADYIMRINPEDDSTALVGPDLSHFMKEGKRGAKWLGAVADNNGAVYMVAHETDFMLKVTPPASSGREPEVSPLETDLSEFGGSKFIGGVLGTDGK